MSDRFAWLTADDQVIEPGDPQHEFWAETFAIEDMAAGGELGPALPKQPKRPEVPPVALALSREAAAESLSMSVDTFDRRVKPEIRVIIEGRRILVPVSELATWIERRSVRALKD